MLPCSLTMNAPQQSGYGQVYALVKQCPSGWVLTNDLAFNGRTLCHLSYRGILWGTTPLGTLYGLPSVLIIVFTDLWHHHLTARV